MRNVLCVLWFSVSTSSAVKGAQVLRELEKDRFLRPADRAIMVRVAAGRRFIGSSEPIHHASEKPSMYYRHPSFAIDRSEISQGQYRSCVGQGLCPEITELKGVDSLPVHSVTFDEARQYCTAMGADLPTEKEWEIAARGSLSTLYPYGPVLKSEPAPSTAAATSVSTGPLEGFGMLHLSTNVSEWTRSAAEYDEHHRLLPMPWSAEELQERRADYEPPKKSSGSFRVIRGGSFRLQYEGLRRATLRRAVRADARHDSLGFRCVVRDVR